MSREENTAESSGSGAHQATTNGHVAPADLPADIGKRPSRLNERPPGERSPYPEKLVNAVPGSPEAACTVGGFYAAEHGVARGKLVRGTGGYETVAQLGSVSLAHAKAAGLIDRDHKPSVGEVSQWYAELDPAWGWEWEPETPATVTDVAALRVAIKGLDPDRRIALTTIDTLAAEGMPWARSAVAKAAADNLDSAMRDKTYSFTLTQLAKDHGATVDDLIELPRMTPEARLASLRLLREWAATDNLRAQNDARRRVAADEAGHLTLPPVTNLDALLAKEDDPVRFRIDGVWPAGGAKVLCAAPAGGGKTTLSGNLVRSLADGDPFLGKFTVNQVAQHIVVIDNEMTEPMLRRWLRRQRVRNTAAVADVVNLRGQAGLFDMSNHRLRGEWARRLRDLGCDVVIFDCLKPVLEAMGLDENRETGKFLYPFAEMLADAAVEDVLVHHHMGHSNERARGDSTLLGWTEANWKIVRKDDHPARPRFFSTDKVRDADEPVGEGLLSFDPATGHLTYVGGDRAQTQATESLERTVYKVLDVLADSGVDGEGMTKTDLRKLVAGKNETIDAAVDLAVKRKQVIPDKRGRGARYRIVAKALNPLYDGEEPTADKGGATTTDDAG